jgi:GGDEF domain-containing protein
MARRLRARTRRSDTLARIESDMFAVILERAEDKNAVRGHLGGLVKALEAPVPWSGSRITVRIQPGLAFCPHDAGDTESLLQVAVADGGELSG